MQLRNFPSGHRLPFCSLIELLLLPPFCVPPSPLSSCSLLPLETGHKALQPGRHSQVGKAGGRWGCPLELKTSSSSLGKAAGDQFGAWTLILSLDRVGGGWGGCCGKRGLQEAAVRQTLPPSRLVASGVTFFRSEPMVTGGHSSCSQCIEGKIKGLPPAPQQVHPAREGDEDMIQGVLAHCLRGCLLWPHCSVFPSGEPGVSGDFWGSQEGWEVP